MQARGQLCATALLTGAASCATGHKAKNAGSPWDRTHDILARIRAPEFPDGEFAVTRFGAKGDGTTDCTDAFAKAIEACNKAGGGRVVVTGGTFLTGPIVLKSNVNLHI